MRVLGVLISELESSFTLPLCDGVLAGARQRGGRVVFLRGGLSGENDVYDRQFRISFRLADIAHMDGFLVCASTIQHHLGVKATKQLVRSLPNVPVVSLGQAVEGVPSLIVDNYGGAFEIVRHLLQTHECRRVAIICGPSGHEEAEQRLQAWRDAYSVCGLVADPELILAGTFENESGRLAMQSLLKSGVPFDAVFAVNDEMAMGAMTVAQEAGYQIPRDIRFAGFDDVLESAKYGVSLSTVNLSSFEIGMQSAHMVFDLLDGKDVGPLTQAKTRLILRHSCGCTSHPVRTVSAESPAPEPGSQNRNEQFGLQQAFEAAVAATDRDIFSRVVTRMLHEVLKTDGHVGNLASQLLELNATLAQQAARVDKDQLLQAASWLQEALVDILSSQELLQYRQHYDELFGERHFHDLLKQRTATFDVQKLLASLTETLQGLDVDTCCIALYEGKGWIRSLDACHIPSNAHLIYAYINNGSRPDLTGETFPTGHLLPDCAWQALGPLTSLSVHPVFHGTEHFGLIISSLPSKNRRVLETIRAEVSSSLKASLLVSELAATRDLLKNDLDRANERHLTLTEIALVDELTGVMNRRGFMDKASSLFRRFQEANLPVAVFFADIDYLKEINDHLGHADGDLAIRETAEVLKSGFRTGDIIGRMGGDEFAVLATLADPKSLEAMRKRLYEAFEAVTRTRKYRFHLGCSIGYVISEPGSVASLTELLKSADTVLYEEKKRRKKKHVIVNHD